MRAAKPKKQSGRAEGVESFEWYSLGWGWGKMATLVQEPIRCYPAPAFRVKFWLGGDCMLRRQGV
jgi:hypothetical protein